MKIPLLLFLIIIFSAISPASGQDGVKKRVPIMVSHLSEDNKAILRRKDAPRHYFLTRVFCFKKKCRAYIGWRKKQRGQRFKGYKDGGKVPRSPKSKPAGIPPLKKDTVIIEPVDPIVYLDTVVMTKQVFVLDEVLFEVNSAHLNTLFTYRLDSLVKLLNDHPKVRAAISGHTDNTGKESHNLKLSKDRAQAVAVYLTKNNIDEDRISFAGWGSSKPIAGNETEEGRRKNRRVEILISEISSPEAHTLRIMALLTMRHEQAPDETTNMRGAFPCSPVNPVASPRAAVLRLSGLDASECVLGLAKRRGMTWAFIPMQTFTFIHPTNRFQVSYTSKVVHLTG